MYVIKKDSADLLILGMLVGQQPIMPDDDSPPIYECTVMWPAMSQLRYENPGRIADLVMVDDDTNEFITVNDICNDSPINAKQPVGDKAYCPDKHFGNGMECEMECDDIPK